jgi:hypothetical protein
MICEKKETAQLEINDNAQRRYENKVNWEESEWCLPVARALDNCYQSQQHSAAMRVVTR